VGSANDWRSVSLSGTNSSSTQSFACGIRGASGVTGDAYYWGGKYWVGFAPGATTNVPLPIGNAHDWYALDAGDAHACGIRGLSGTRTVFCLGDNTYGQLGVPRSGGSTLTPVQALPSGDWTMVRATALATLTYGPLSGTWGFGGREVFGDGALCSDFPTEIVLPPP
jgi:hypothetical protein